MILLIDNYDSFTYNLYQALSKLGAEVTVVRNDKITVDEVAAMPLDAIVLSPGPGGPEDAGITIDLIRQLGSQVPILGVCLGHQAIGAAFDASVTRANAILHGKESLIFHRRGPLFKDISLPFIAGRYHSLMVSHQDLPTDLVVEAEDSSGEIMALSHRTHPIFGVQFHPESILTPEGEQLLKNFLDYALLYKKTA